MTKTTAASHHPIRTALAALLLATLALLALAPSAPAAKRWVDSIGDPSSGFFGGQFNFNQGGGVGVNRTGAGGVAPGTVYVADGQNSRVQQLSPAGAFVRAWGTGVLTGGGTQFEICESAASCFRGSTRVSHPGSLATGRDVVVDQSTGHLYVSTSGDTFGTGGRVSVFSATGQPQGAFGFGILDGSPELQFCTVATGCQATRGGGPGGSLNGAGGELSIPEFTPPSGIALAPSGEVYLTGSDNGRVDVFIPTLSGAEVTDVSFSRALGWDVVRSGPGDSAVDEVARLTVRATGGSFVIRVPGVGDTDPIPHDAPATGPGSVQEALNALLAPSGGSVAVTGGPGDQTGSTPYEIAFGGAYAGDDVALQAFSSFSGDPLTGGSPESAAILETLQEGGAYEVCRAAAGDVCKRAPRTDQATEPGRFNSFVSVPSPSDIAVDAAGDVYALDRGARFDERQRVAVSASGGTYTLTFQGQTTDPIPFDAQAFQIAAALAELPAIGAGNVRQFDRDSIEFLEALGALDVPELTCDASGLGGGTCTVTTLRQGSLNPPRVQVFGSADAPIDGAFGAAGLIDAFGPNRDARHLALDPDTGNLLVAGGGLDTAGDPRVAELDPAGALAVLHGTNLPLGNLAPLRGLAAAPASLGGNLYLLSHFEGTLVGAFVLAENPPQIDPPLCGPTSADLSGIVFSDGQPVSYRFEYVTEAQFQASGWEKATRVPATDVTVGPAPAEIAVAQTATGLTGSQDYRFRLIATRLGTRRISDEVTCTTDPAPPAVSAAGVVVDRDAAILKARINPQNQPTTYRFQYTTEADFAANGWTNALRAPDPGDAQLPAGNAPVFVAQEIAGLSPAIAYRSRILAANATPPPTTGAEQPFTTLPPFQDPDPDQDCPNEAFRGGPSAQLPDCRAYELVSPPGAPNISLNHYLAADGSRAAYHALGAFADAPQSTINFYLAERGASGWSSSPLVPPLSQPTPPDLHHVFTQRLMGFSDDLSRVYLVTEEGADPADGDDSDIDLYLREPDRSFHWVSTTPCEGTSNQNFAGASADGSHAVFFSLGKLCESIDAGAPREVAVLPGGGVCPTAPLAGAWGAASSTPGNAYGSVSADGRRIFFGCEGALYVRTDGATTDQIANPGAFAAAARDGSAVFFTSAASFVPEDSNGAADLYRYDLDPGAYTRLTPDSLAGDPAPRVRTGTSSGVAVSEDGSRVYFVAQGVLTTEPNAHGQSATDGIDNLYVWDDGELRFVASPQSGDGQGGTESALDVVNPRGSVRAGGGVPASWDLSADGAHLAFATGDAVLPADADSSADVYVYDLAERTLALATTGPRGGDGAFPALLGNRYPSWGARRPRLLSDDGRFLFFETREPLTTRDVNDRLDVYQRDLDTGQTWLISNGASANDALLIGISDSGADVFFRDPRPLAPQDTDAEPSIYTARIGGGFPAEFDGSCQGDACKPPPSAPPGDPPPASSTLSGPGNQGKNLSPAQAKKKAKGKSCKKIRNKKKRKRCQKKNRKQKNRGRR